MCSPGRGTYITRDTCFPGGGTHFIRDMCFPGGGRHITWDTCFPGGGTHMTTEMCFQGGGTLITGDMCFPCREGASQKRMCRSWLKQFLFLFSIGGFYVTSSPWCWWMVNKRFIISLLFWSTSICSFHHCYLCLPRLHENHLFDNIFNRSFFRFFLIIYRWQKVGKLKVAGDSAGAFWQPWSCITNDEILYVSERDRLHSYSANHSLPVIYTLGFTKESLVTWRVVLLCQTHDKTGYTNKGALCISYGLHLLYSSYGDLHTATAHDALCPSAHVHGRMAWRQRPETNHRNYPGLRLKIILLPPHVITFTKDSEEQFSHLVPSD